MKLSGPDHAIVRFLELAQRHRSTRAASLTVSLGRSYARSCDACGHAHHAPQRAGIERCTRCGSAWRFEDVEVLRGQVQMTRRFGADWGLLDLATLGTLIDRVPTWPRRALLLHVGVGLSRPETAEEIVARWPRAPRPMTVDVVRRLVTEGRAHLERRLQRARLLA